MCGLYVGLPCMVIIVDNAIGYLFFSDVWLREEMSEKIKEFI